MAQGKGLHEEATEETKQDKFSMDTLRKEVKAVQDRDELSWDVISQAAKPWLFGAQRVRGEPNTEEYIGITHSDAKAIVHTMYRTNVLLAKARAWLGSMQITRRSLQGRYCMWDDLHFETACETPLGMICALNEFQAALVASGFSFHNILVRKATILQLTDSGLHQQVGNILGIVQRQLLKEWQVWRDGTRGAKRVLDGPGDNVFDYLIVESSPELDDEILRNVMDPWASFGFAVEDFGPQVMLASTAPSVALDAFFDSTVCHPKAELDLSQSSFPRNSQPTNKMARTTSTRGSMADSRLSSRRSSEEMAFMARAQEYAEEEELENPVGDNNRASPSNKYGNPTRENQSVPPISGPTGRSVHRTQVSGNSGDPFDPEDFYGGGGTSQAVAPMWSPAMFGMQQLSVFDGKGSPRDNREWFDQFEFLAGSCGWTPKQKLNTLKYYCKGAAREWWTYQARQGSLHWSQLRPVFIETFCTDTRSKTQLYITAQQKTEETSLEFYRRLTNLAKRAGVKLNYADPWEEHVDLFLSGLRSRDTRNQLRVFQFTDSAEIEATLKRMERTARSSRSVRFENDEETMGNTRLSGALLKAKPRTKPSAPQSSDPDFRPKPKKAQAYLTQLEDETEDEEEDEYAAYSIKDENGEEQVYMARIKDVMATDTRPTRDDRPREKCSTCGKPGHAAATCWLKMKCTECGSVGHPAEVCFRRCGFCDKTHEKRGPCPLKGSVAELVQWARATAESSDKNLPALPEQLLNW